MRRFRARPPLPPLGFASLIVAWVTVPLLIVAIDVLVSHAYTPLIIFIFLAPVWGILTAISVLRCCYLIFKGRWWPGLLALIFLTIVFLNWDAALFQAKNTGDVVRFIMLKPAYDIQVALQRAQRTPQLIEFNWGGMTFASDGVVYDPTDEVALPKKRRSAAWQVRQKNTDLMCGEDDLVYRIYPLWDHYYLAGFGC